MALTAAWGTLVFAKPGHDVGLVLAAHLIDVAIRNIDRLGLHATLSSFGATMAVNLAEAYHPHRRTP